MKLNTLVEFDFQRALRRTKGLLNIMPKNKQNHSIRVARHLHKIGTGKTGVYAGLFHDYIEQGGDIANLADLGLSPQVILIIKSLSNDEKNLNNNENQPLIHVRNVLNQIMNQDLRNLIILIKLADRIDNLRKRIEAGRTNKNYIQKSLELYKFLYSQYTGESKPFKKLKKQLESILPI